MNKTNKVYIVSFFTITLLLSACSSKNETPGSTCNYTLDSLQTNSMDTVAQVIEQKVLEFSAENLLLVFDIDNTILTADEDLGSDFWYQWQREKLRTKPSEEQRVHKLFDQIPLLYELATMRLTENILTEKINSWQDSIAFICLTARSPEARSATERELHKNDVFPQKNPIRLLHKGKEIGFHSSYTSNDSTTRKISYLNGIMMVQGLNKGELLQHLLDYSDSNFEAVVFVDDSKKNYEHVKAAFRNNSSTQMTAIHYTKIEEERKAANNGLIMTPEQAENMHLNWILLKKCIADIYPERIQ